jgi:enterochelin esterase-like enzyme
MLTESLSSIIVEQKAVASAFLKRYVIIDLYLPKNIEDPGSLSLLLINDGQDLEEMKFAGLLNGLIASGQMKPMVAVGIHAGKDRKNEYGTSGTPDFAGRGAKAEKYEQFILEELLPFIHNAYGIQSFGERAFAGFSLGGLTALDLTWNHPSIFSTAGVFSGSLWWRSRDLDDDYDDNRDRIMHQRIKNGTFNAGQKFYFTTGSLDETADRNQNGIIDSIDDTLDLVKALKRHGYSDKEIRYENFEDGKHDVATWARAMPGFLLWGWKGEEKRS